MSGPSEPVRLPVRASRWLSVTRQLVIVLPPIAGIVLISVGIAAVTTLGWGLCCLIPAVPAAMVGGARIGRRVDYWFDTNRGGVLLDGPALSVRLEDGNTFSIDLDQPYIAEAGWWSNRLNQPPLPGNVGTMRDHSEGIHLYLAQLDRSVLLYSEDGLATAPETGVPCRRPEHLPDHRVRMWAEDLVALIHTVGAAQG